MPISVRVDAKTERMIDRLAKRTGRTKSQIIREGIAALAGSQTSLKWQRPYEAMEHLIGCARGGPSDLSEQTGRKLRLDHPLTRTAPPR
jgi:hypothetical protein